MVLCGRCQQFLCAEINFSLLHTFLFFIFLLSCPTNRDDFSVKLALLSNQWQGVVRRAQQRRGIIDSLVRQWQNYREMAEKLLRWLQEVTSDPDVHQPGEPVALQQARNLLDQIQVGYNTMEDVLLNSLLKLLISFEICLSKIFMILSSLPVTILIRINFRWIWLPFNP